MHDDTKSFNLLLIFRVLTVEKRPAPTRTDSDDESDEEDWHAMVAKKAKKKLEISERASISNKIPKVCEKVQFIKQVINLNLLLQHI